MALLTRINDRPLYSTVQEATAWATSRGLTGFHTHTYQGQIGYMGGANHTQAVNLNNTNTTSSTPTTSIRTNGSSNSYNTGGGGGGY